MMPETRADTTRMQLDPGPYAPRVARGAVQRALLQAGAVDMMTVEQAMLLTSELVTNAVIHAHTGVVLSIDVDEAAVRVRVEDGDHRLPMPATTSGPHGGFGLHIVERLADTWGTAASNDGKAVWFQLDLHAPRDRHTRDELHGARG